LSFYRRRIRPVTKAIEKGVKSAFRGDEEGQHLDAYQQRLPGILKRIEHEAREGMLSRALY